LARIIDTFMITFPKRVTLVTHNTFRHVRPTRRSTGQPTSKIQERPHSLAHVDGEIQITNRGKNRISRPSVGYQIAIESVQPIAPANLRDIRTC
jgi:hypothetical protein